MSSIARLTAGAIGIAATITAWPGGAPAHAATVLTTYSYTGPAVPIPDAADLTGDAPGPAATATILVAGATGVTSDLDFRFDGDACSNVSGSTTVGLDHGFVSDLHISLTSPGGTTVLMTNEADGSGNNFCQTVLDDDSAAPAIQGAPSASAPFTGTWTPNSPLSAFDGENPNGTWTLSAQDFFSSDSGNIRAFSLLLTTALPPAIATTKTVSGTFAEGGTVTYTVTSSNSGDIAAPDNAGNEMTDVLPAGLTLVSASASSGTASATVGTNTVTWNGVVPAGGSVTTTITATINAGTASTVITNQAQVAIDSDADGTNETSVPSDDPGAGGASDPTTFGVAPLPLPASVSATKTVSGTFAEGGVVTYTLTSTNSGEVASGDNPGNELTDVLPAGLTLVSANATSGTASANPGANTVTWNGSLNAGASVTVTITAIVHAGTESSVISNQATVAYDSDGNGTNDASAPSDDPGLGGAVDPTSFAVAGVPPTVTIEAAAGQADPTPDSPILFDVVFSEPVTGFEGTDVVLSGSAGATTAVVTGSGAVYQVAVSGMTGNGEVIATIPAGAALDLLANPSAASESEDNAVGFQVPEATTTTTIAATTTTAATTIAPSTTIATTTTAGGATGAAPPTTISPTAPSIAELPATGAPSHASDVGYWAAVLVLVGAALVLFVRKRRPAPGR